jgi:putative ABC transport system ATP-binding protein
MELFRSLNREGLTVILVTHEPDIAHYAERQIHFKDGRVVADHAIAGAPRYDAASEVG